MYICIYMYYVTTKLIMVDKCIIAQNSNKKKIWIEVGIEIEIEDGIGWDVSSRITPKPCAMSSNTYHVFKYIYLFNLARMVSRILQ